MAIVRLREGRLFQSYTAAIMATSGFVEHCLELFSAIGQARARRMFGGHGFYMGDLFFALIADDRLFLKVDALSRPAFEAAGCEPFVYTGQAKPVTMSYWTVPADAMDAPSIMEPWARQALRAARDASLKRKPAVKSARRLAPAKRR